MKNDGVRQWEGLSHTLWKNMFETTNQLKAIHRIGKPQAVVVEILHYGNKHGAFLELGDFCDLEAETHQLKGYFHGGKWS